VLGLALIAIPIIAFLSAAFSARRDDLNSPDVFYTAHRRVDVTVFSTSSVAYAFQMSTIYPFMIWGASHFFLVPIVNTVCWGLGIYLFNLCFTRYQGFVGRDQTLHGFLGAQYGSPIRKLASYLTITGFLGLAIAELYFGSQVLVAIAPSRAAVYGCIIGVSLVVYAYIAYGGQVSSMRTDQLQLAISYIGFFGIGVYLLYVLATTSSAHASYALKIALGVCLVYIPSLIYIRRGRFIGFGIRRGFGAVVRRTLNVSIVALLVALCITALYVLCAGSSTGQASTFFDLTGFGVPGLISLALLPLCFQFVDLTNWQRLLSVKPDPKRNVGADIGRGLLIYAAESPFTWLFALFFGLLAAEALTGLKSDELLIDLPRRLLQSNASRDHVVGYVFVLSVLSVMLSTVDSFLVGIIYTFAYDSWTPSRKILDTGDGKLIEARSAYIKNAGRAFGFCALASTVILLFVFDRSIPRGGELFVNLLLAFYSAQLSFFPLVFGVLFLHDRPSALWAGASMVVGASSGIALGIYSVIWNTSLAWYPLLVCFGLSCGIYSVGYCKQRS
jgi:hypothetical protein